MKKSKEKLYNVVRFDMSTFPATETVILTMPNKLIATETAKELRDNCILDLTVSYFVKSA